MKISHTWINEDGTEMAWATPSRREIGECKKDNGEDVLAYCKPPRGWDFTEAGDASETSDDGGNPGRYLIRA